MNVQITRCDKLTDCFVGDMTAPASGYMVTLFFDAEPTRADTTEKRKRFCALVGAAILAEFAVPDDAPLNAVDHLAADEADDDNAKRRRKRKVAAQGYAAESSL